MKKLDGFSSCEPVLLCPSCDGSATRHNEGCALRLSDDPARRTKQQQFTRTNQFVFSAPLYGRPNASTRRTAQNVLTTFRSGGAIRVVVMGNSIACGYYATNYASIVRDANGRISAAQREASAATINGWVQRLGDYITGVNASSHVINLSGDGWNTNNHADGATDGEGYVSGRGGTFALIDAMTVVPDMALIPLQVNDATFSLSNTFEQNTRSIVSQLQQRGIVPVIVLENSTGSGNAVVEYADALATTLGVAKISLYVPAIDWGAHPEWYEDSTHPNNDGHTQMYTAARAWFDTATAQP